MKGSWILGIAISLACVACTPRLPSQASDREDRQSTQELSLGTFQCVRGTPFLRAPLIASAWRSFSSSYDEGVTRNHVFLNVDEVSFRKLLEADDRVILRSVDLPERVSYKPREEAVQATCKNAPSPVEYLLYLVVNRDTNGDKKLSWEDSQVLAIADPSGQNYVELVPDIEDLHGYVYRPESKDLVLMYRREDASYVSVIDLAGREVNSTETIDILESNIQ